MTKLVNISRRNFIGHSIVGVATLPFIGSIINKDLAIAEDTLKPISIEDPLAKAQGYVPDATKVDVSKYPKKAAEGGDKQKCSTCILFREGGQKVEGFEGEYGKCAIFPGSLVAASGWCQLWAQNPAVAS